MPNGYRISNPILFGCSLLEWVSVRGFRWNGFLKIRGADDGPHLLVLSPWRADVAGANVNVGAIVCAGACELVIGANVISRRAARKPRSNMPGGVLPLLSTPQRRSVALRFATQPGCWADRNPTSKPPPPWPPQHTTLAIWSGKGAPMAAPFHRHYGNHNKDVAYALHHQCLVSDLYRQLGLAAMLSNDANRIIMAMDSWGCSGEDDARGGSKYDSLQCQPHCERGWGCVATPRPYWGRPSRLHPGTRTRSQQHQTNIITDDDKDARLLNTNRHRQWQCHEDALLCRS